MPRTRSTDHHTATRVASQTSAVTRQRGAQAAARARGLQPRGGAEAREREQPEPAEGGPQPGLEAGQRAAHELRARERREPGRERRRALGQRGEARGAAVHERERDQRHEERRPREPGAARAPPQHVGRGLDRAGREVRGRHEARGDGEVHARRGEAAALPPAQLGPREERQHEEQRGRPAPADGVRGCGRGPGQDRRVHRDLHPGTRAGADATPEPARHVPGGWARRDARARASGCPPRGRTVHVVHGPRAAQSAAEPRASRRSATSAASSASARSSRWPSRIVRQVVDREVDAVVGDPALREVVGADLGAAVAGRDLRLALRRVLRLLLLQLGVVEARAQHLHRLRAVLDLRALVLAGDDEAGRQVGDAHGGVGGVDALPAGAAGAVDVDAEVLLLDVDVHLLDLGQHRHGGGRGVDAARTPRSSGTRCTRCTPLSYFMLAVHRRRPRARR